MENSPQDTKFHLIADLLQKIEHTEHPETLWDQAVELARSQDLPGIHHGEVGDLSTDEIVRFGERIRKMHSIDEKYRILMEKTSSGKLWYDVLLGEGNMALFVPVEDAVKQRCQKIKVKWGNAADIGTGTGNALCRIAPYCENVHGVDLADFPLRTAREIGLPANASLVRGSADRLPFPDQSLDLVVSHGLIYYFSQAETDGFIRELSRTLKHGGTFYQSAVISRREDIVPKIFHADLENVQAPLIHLIGELSSERGHPESPEMSDFVKSMQTNGFSVTKASKDTEERLLFEFTRQ